MANEIEPGQPAPDFRAVTTSGAEVRLEDFRGRWLVLYFSPKAFTPGCTKESRRFRDNYPELQALGAEVIGIHRRPAGAVRLRSREHHRSRRQGRGALHHEVQVNRHLDDVVSFLRERQASA